MDLRTAFDVGEDEAANCLVEPAGDIVPQLAPATANFTIIRAALNTVSINGT